MKKQLPPLLAPFQGETEYLSGLYVSAGVKALMQAHGADWLPLLANFMHTLYASDDYYYLLCPYGQPEIWVMDSMDLRVTRILFPLFAFPAATRLYRYGNLLMTQEEDSLLSA